MSQEAVGFYATADFEGVAGSALCLAWQGPDCQVSIEVLEDLESGPLRVFAEQAVKVFEP